jgi:hypothetical protein
MVGSFEGEKCSDLVEAEWAVIGCVNRTSPKAKQADGSFKSVMLRGMATESKESRDHEILARWLAPNRARVLLEKGNRE